MTAPRYFELLVSKQFLPHNNLLHRRLRGSTSLLVMGNVVLISRVLFTLKMQATRFFELSVLARPTRCHITGNGVLHSHHRENLKFYFVWICLYVQILHIFSVMTPGLRARCLLKIKEISTRGMPKSPS
jgi:hypothetical protein